MNKQISSKFSSSNNAILVVALLLISCLIIPKYNADFFNSTIRCLLLFAVVGLFGLTQLFKKEDHVPFYFVDFMWLGLITFTGASILWATNELYAIYGLATTTLLYLCYKAFESINWTGKNSMLALAAITLCILFNFGIEMQALKRYLFPFLFDRSGLDISVLHELKLNLNFLGSSLVILLPFLLFRAYKKNMVFDFSVLAIVLFLIAHSGSAQVMLAAIFLAIFYAIHQLKISVKKIATLLLGLSGVLFASLLLIYLTRGSLFGLSFVTDEFFTQNDRLWMWGESLSMLTDTPLTGCGKNNWPILVGQFGLEGCQYCLKDPYTIKFFKHAHNSIFQILAEGGILGFLFYIGIGVFPIVQVFRGKETLPPLVLSAVASLLLFFYLSMTYGVVYNFFDSFSGLTILMVFNLALCSQFLYKDKTEKGKLSNLKFYVVYILFSIGGFFFFFQKKQAEYHIESGTQLLGQKKYEQAATAFSQAIPFTDPSLVYTKLMATYTKMKDKQTATSYLQKAVEQHPYNPMINFHYGNLLSLQGEYEQAQEFALFTQSIAPNFILNKILLIRCYFRNGEKEKAKVMRDELLHQLKRFLPNKRNLDQQLPPHIIQRNKKVKRHIELLEKLS